MNLELLREELPAHALRAITLRAWQESEQEGFRAALAAHHYLGAPSRRQCVLGQVALLGERPVALLTWTHGVRALAAREAWVGWDARTRQRRLGLVVQNNRFVVLSAVRQTNLASRVLGLAVQALPEQWAQRRGVPPLLAETFVDPVRYAGTCYKAAGWQEVGATSGRGHLDYYQDDLQPKALWLRELTAGAARQLRDPHTPCAGEQRRAGAALPVPTRTAESLAQAFWTVPDPRRRREFPLPALLAAAVLGLASGARTISDLFRLVQDLTLAQRRALGFRFHQDDRRRVPPPGEGCWRDVLRRIDPAAVAAAFNQWRQQQTRLPAILAIDGKTLHGNLATLVSLVDATDGVPLAQAARAGAGHEKALARDLVAALPPGTLDGRMVIGDALYADKTLVHELVQTHGAVVVVQLKDNQPHAQARSEALLAQTNPPFSTAPSRPATAVSKGGGCAP
jgi:hypothetical protein